MKPSPFLRNETLFDVLGVDIEILHATTAYRKPSRPLFENWRRVVFSPLDIPGWHHVQNITTCGRQAIHQNSFTLSDA